MKLPNGKLARTADKEEVSKPLGILERIKKRRNLASIPKSKERNSKKRDLISNEDSNLKKVFLSELYTEGDFEASSLSLKMNQIQQLKKVPFKTYNPVSLEEKSESFEAMKVISPYKSRRMREFLANNASVLNKEDILAKLRDQVKKLEVFRQSKLERNGKLFIIELNNAEMIVEISRSRQRKQQEKVDWCTLRKKIISQVVLQGIPQVQVSKNLKVSPSFVSKNVNYFLETGDLPTSTGRGRPKKIHFDWGLVKEHLLIKRQTEWRMFLGYSRIIEHLKTEFLVLCNYRNSTIANFLRKECSCSIRKLERTGSRLSPSMTRALSLHYLNEILDLVAQDKPLLFVDESSIQSSNFKKAGVSIDRKPVTVPSVSVDFGVNILLACTLDSVVGLQLSTARYNGNQFTYFLQEVVSAYRRKRQILVQTIHIVLDNALPHYCCELLDFLRKENVVLHYMPPKTPQLNAAEGVFCLLKKFIRNTAKLSKKEIMEGLSRYLSSQNGGGRGEIRSLYLKELNKLLNSLN